MITTLECGCGTLGSIRITKLISYGQHFKANSNVLSITFDWNLQFVCLEKSFKAIETKSKSVKNIVISKSCKQSRLILLVSQISVGNELLAIKDISIFLNSIKLIL